MRAKATVSALAELGLEVDLLALPFGEDPTIPGVRLIRAPKIWGIRHIPIGPSWSKLLYDFSLFAAALRLVVKRRYAVLHGVEEAGVMAAFLGRVFGIPYVFDMHSHMSEQIRDRTFCGAKALARFVAFLERVAICGAGAVMTVGDRHTARAKSIAADVPGVTVQDIALDSATVVDLSLVASLREQHALADKRVFLYSGNFDPCQGIELLLEGFACFRKKKAENTVSSVLLVVGGGVEEEKRRKALAAKVSDLDLNGSVLFLGRQPPEQMGTFMALADVLVSPRVSGGNTPLKIYSYMAACRPIVATNISSHTQAIDETCAYLCDPEPEALGESLQRAVDASDAEAVCRSVLVRQAKDKLEACFSKRSFLEKISRLYSFMIRLPHAAEADTACCLDQSRNSASASARQEAAR